MTMKNLPEIDSNQSIWSMNEKTNFECWLTRSSAFSQFINRVKKKEKRKLYANLKITQTRFYAIVVAFRILFSHFWITSATDEREFWVGNCEQSTYGIEEIKNKQWYFENWNFEFNTIFHDSTFFSHMLDMPESIPQHSTHWLNHPHKINKVRIVSIPQFDN